MCYVHELYSYPLLLLLSLVEEQHKTQRRNMVELCHGRVQLAEESDKSKITCRYFLVTTLQLQIIKNIE